VNTNQNTKQIQINTVCINVHSTLRNLALMHNINQNVTYTRNPLFTIMNTIHGII